VSRNDGESWIPSVVPVGSKSRGIIFLKESMKILNDKINQPELKVLQEKLELECSNQATERLKFQVNCTEERGQTFLNRNMRILVGSWHSKLSSEISSSLTHPEALYAIYNASIAKGSIEMYVKVLSFLVAETISLICLQEMTIVSDYDATSRSITLVKLASRIGNHLDKETFATQLSKQKFKKYINFLKNISTKMFQAKNFPSKILLEESHRLEKNIEAVNAGWLPLWPHSLKFEIGAFIASLAIKCLEFRPNEPVFNHSISRVKLQQVGVVTIHEKVFKLLTLTSNHSIISGGEPWAIPMLVPPRRWTSFRKGGYLKLDNICLRMKHDPVHYNLLRDADCAGQLKQIFAGLDALGKTAWRINESVLKVLYNISFIFINIIYGGHNAFNFR
jgi:DNA-directed RNA polymerase